MRHQARTSVSAALAAALLGLVLPSPEALAQTRRVTLNGQALSDAQVARLDALQCTRIPDGHYWMDLQTGIWGYARSPQPQGRLGDRCADTPRQPSLSERRQLYRPGEILSGN